MENSVSSLEKGLDILCAYNLNNEPLSAQSISKQLNMPISTTYRYLMTLEKRGFLVRDRETKNYKLGFILFKLGNIVSSQMKLVDIILPYMKSLSSISGETVWLTVASGWEAVCIEIVEADRVIKFSLKRGVSLPLHAAASSKILLAYQKDSFINSMFKKTVLKRFTKNTITDPLLLKKELKKIRRQGFAFSDQEVYLGTRGIGAPIFNHKGEIVAGLTIAGPRERITDKKIPRCIQLVKESALRASYELGYSGI
jgi:IclR family acetate operon transcriptional repressor